MTYKETLDTLYNMLPDFQNIGADAYKPGLERAEEFNRWLGSPDKSFASVHVAGTNGKGSVSHMLASTLQQAGYRVGLYTSPHMTDFRERIRVDGVMIPEEYVVGFTAAHLDKMNRLRMSFFEATMAMAFRYFADSDVEVAVIEAGLGGRLDSTNIITPVLSVITNIGMDHMALLGDTPEKIAAEKAGIIKRGVPVVIGETDPHSAPVFEKAAAGAGSAIVFADARLQCAGRRMGGDGIRYFSFERSGSHETFEVGTDLMGDYQCKNLITALTAIDMLNHHSHISISNRAAIAGCSAAARSTGLRGRWQIVGRNPLTVLDSGHNAHGLKETMRQIGSQEYDKLYFILGVAADKDLGAMLELLPRDAHYIFTQASVKRAMDVGKLAEAAQKAGLTGEVAPSVAEAMLHARRQAKPEDMIFVGGSSFVVADALEGLK